MGVSNHNRWFDLNEYRTSSAVWIRSQLPSPSFKHNIRTLSTAVPSSKYSIHRARPLPSAQYPKSKTFYQLAAMSGVDNINNSRHEEVYELQPLFKLGDPDRLFDSPLAERISTLFTMHASSNGK